MRSYRLLSTIAVAALACLAHGSAVAGPINSDGQALAVVSPLQAPADASLAAKTSEPGERTRLVSYLILRGLQGASPLVGGR